MDQHNVLKFELPASRALELVREIAKDSSRVKFTLHAEQRMVAREITRRQVLCCLTHGHITEGPARDVKGNWKMTMEVLSAGDVVNTVLAIDYDDRGNLVIIVTVY